MRRPGPGRPATGERPPVEGEPATRVATDHARVSDADDLAALRAERDELAREVEVLRARPGSRLRRALVAVLVVVAGLAVALAPVAVWARAQVLETDRWVAVAGPLADEPAVQRAMADWATDQLVALIDPEALLADALSGRAERLVGPLAGALTGFVHDRVAAYLRTDDFAALWREAVGRAHEAALRVLEGESDVVTAGGSSITIDLLPLLQRVLDRITAASPELFGRRVDIPEIDLDDVPDDAAVRLGAALGVDVPDDLGQITVYDRGRLRAVQDGLHRLGRLVGLVVALAVVAPVAAVALSRRRLRTTAAVAAVALVGLVLLRRGTALLVDEVLARITEAGARGAADRLLERLLDPLATATAWMAAVAALVVVVRLVGPRLAARVDRAALGRGVRSIGGVLRRNPLVAQAAVVAAGLAVLWLSDLGLVGSLLVVAATAAAALALGRLPAVSDPS